MRTLLLSGLLALATLPLAAPAHAIGCVSGAVLGGVGGHFAGRHGLVGAAAGCAVGHQAAVRQNRERAAARDAGRQQQQQPDLERARQPRPY